MVEADGGVGGHQVRPRPTRRRGEVLLAAVVVAAVAALAAAGCSSSSTGSSASRAPGTRPAGAVTSGSGAGGWDCPGGVCPWDDGSVPPTTPPSGARSAPAPTSAPGRGTTSTTGSGATSRPSADPTTGDTAGATPLPASTGTIDDAADWASYLRYRTAFATQEPGLPGSPVAGRRVLTVVDERGRPVPGAQLTVTDPGGATVERTTMPDGRAVVVPSASGPGPATVTATANGASTTTTLAAGDMTITLAGGRPTAPGGLDVLFLLDATASMQDELAQLQQAGPDLAELMVGTPGGGEVRVALTVYRDRQDLFRTRTFDFTSDPSAFVTALGEVRAGGGNDTPEDLEAGLHDALTKPSWRGPATAKIVVLVTDAPPHLDAASPSYLDSVERAAARGVSILPVASSGIDRRGEFVLRDLAQATLGTVVVQTRGADGTSPGAPMPHAVREDDLSASSSDRIIRSSLQRRLDAVDS